MAGGRLTKEALLKIVGDDADAAEKLDAIKLKADELRASNPTLKIRIDTLEAREKLKVFREQLNFATRDKTVEIKVKEDGKFRQLLDRLVGIGGSAGGGAAGGGLQSAGGGLSGILSTGPIGIGLLVAALGALSVPLAGLVSGLVAATGGIAAFGLVALPTFKNVTNALTAITAAQKNYAAAQALQATDPTAAHATAAANALDKLRAVQSQMSPSTREAVAGIQSLTAGFDKLAKSMQPLVLKVFGDGLKVLNAFLPALKPLAEAAGGAIDGLLKRLAVFAQSKGFQDWIRKFSAEAGPAITAIGLGLGKIINDVGKLITRFNGRDVVQAINFFVDPIVFGITLIRGTINRLMNNWDQLTGDTAKAWHFMGRAVAEGQVIVNRSLLAIGRVLTQDVPRWISEGVAWFRGLPGRILGAIGNLGGLLVSAGRSIIDGLINGIKSAIPGLSGVLGWVTSLIPSWKGPLDRDRKLLEPNGMALISGLNAGITSALPSLSATLSRATDTIAGHGYGTGRAGGHGGLTLEMAPGGGTPLEQMFWSWFRKQVRVKGGDPNVLGR